MSIPSSNAFVSRGGDKLSAALDHFGVDVRGRICADLGSHVGGFVDCLLQRGAEKIFSVDTSYGTLAWKLRRDPRVTVLERTNAMHVALPEPVDLVTIDAGWTRQAKILPNAARLLRGQHSSASGGLAADSAWRSPGGIERERIGSDDVSLVLTLIKPHYEAGEDLLAGGVLPDQHVEEVVAGVLQGIRAEGWTIEGTFESPVFGHAGNREVFGLLRRGQITGSVG